MKPIHWPGLCGFTCECKLVTRLWNVIVFHAEEFVSSTQTVAVALDFQWWSQERLWAFQQPSTWMHFVCLHSAVEVCALAFMCVHVGLWMNVDNDAEWQHHSDVWLRSRHTRLESVNKLTAIYRAKMTKSAVPPASVLGVVAERNRFFKMQIWEVRHR